MYAYMLLEKTFGAKMAASENFHFNMYRSLKKMFKNVISYSKLPVISYVCSQVLVPKWLHLNNS